MPLKIVKVAVAAIPGVLDVLEEHMAVDPTYVHATRLGEFGIGFIGSLMVHERHMLADPLEALMLASEPLAIKSIYSLLTGAVEGTAPTKEAIELKLKRAGQLRPELMTPQLR